MQSGNQELFYITGAAMGEKGCLGGSKDSDRRAIAKVETYKEFNQYAE